jgi:hypothetical protein
MPELKKHTEEAYGRRIMKQADRCNAGIELMLRSKLGLANGKKIKRASYFKRNKYQESLRP